MDEFTISLPRERSFGTVAELVVGGIAARHDVTLDVLDDLQIALDALLDHGDADEGEISILLRVEEGTIELLRRTVAAGHRFRSGVGRRRRDRPEARARSRRRQRRAQRARRRLWVELRKGYARAESGS